MTRIPDNGQDQSHSPLSDGVEAFGPQALMHAGYPMLLAGVNRKINTGNFENIDVYCAVSVPIMLLPGQDLEAFKQAVIEAAEIGFGIASRETGGRYAKIKEMQRAGRPNQQPPE